MNRYNEKCCGKYFIKDHEIYQCIGYCPHPTLTFINLKTQEKESWADCCQIIEGFKELTEVKND